mmetsp:Transcript_4268/g.5705  ORF Transcript_4268/g.5705 Transcript_4268/m.5705 type:complete len:84 (-) Transcript_4268:7-258(-)
MRRSLTENFVAASGLVSVNCAPRLPRIKYSVLKPVNFEQQCGLASVSSSRKTRAKTTPMMKQYLDQKQKYPECVLLFRSGDFF